MSLSLHQLHLSLTLPTTQPACPVTYLTPAAAARISPWLDNLHNCTSSLVLSPCVNGLTDGWIMEHGWCNLRWSPSPGQWSHLGLQCPAHGKINEQNGERRGALLAPSMRKVEAMLPSDMIRYEPVDEFWRGAG